MTAIMPKFSAVLIRPNDVQKLGQINILDASSLEDLFEQPCGSHQHQTLNAALRGALISQSGDKALHIGSTLVKKDEEGRPPVRDGYVNAIIFNTRADAQPGTNPLKSKQSYIAEHSDEQALVTGLKAANIRYETNPFRVLYNQVYNVKNGQF